VASIRAYLRVQPFDQVAQTVLEQTIREAAQTKEDLADIIKWIGFSNAIFPRHLREPLGGWSSRSGRTRGWWQRCRGGAEGCSNAPRKA
jgi:hypothetical protein